MCITSEDVRSQEEVLVWDILCEECVDKAIKLIEERKKQRLFDIYLDEYGFCPKCTEEIKYEADQLMKAEFGDEIP
jgi:hypothetical protein